MWTISGETEPLSIVPPLPSTHSLVTTRDIGHTLDSHLRYRMEAGVTDLDVKEIVT